MSNNTADAFLRLVGIMDDLRAKCPWDKKQTMDSLAHLTIEETYELVDAIAEKDSKNIKEELGDLFLHLVFYAKIGSENNEFTLEEILHSISDKLIHRHPHIYGDVQADTEEEVKKNWEKLKLKEGRKSMLEGVPKSLPAMVKAYRIQEKVKQVGFEWEHIQQVWDKVSEEIQELKEAEKTTDIDKIEDEYGDVLFALINLGRFLKIEPEKALQRTNKKFITRFQYIENNAEKPLSEMTLSEMDTLWNAAKNE